MADLLDGLDRSAATHLAAEMARAGLHDTTPYWSPDTESKIDPFDDPEYRALVRGFLGRMWTEARSIAR